MLGFCLLTSARFEFEKDKKDDIGRFGAPAAAATTDFLATGIFQGLKG